MAIRNFDVVVTRSATSGHYRVAADSTTHGQAEETVLAPASILSMAEVFERSIDEFELASLGTQLFESLLGGSLGVLFNTVLGPILMEGDSALRVRLRIEPPELAVIPWELAFDPLRSRFIAAYPKILLSRFLGILEPVRPLEVKGAIHLLVVIPEHSGLDSEMERRALHELG